MLWEILTKTGAAVDVVLVRPSPDLEEEFLRFHAEWEQSGEDITPWAAGLRGRSYREWLADTRRAETEAAPGMVTASVYLLLDGDRRVLGAIQIRHALNDYLFNIGGHIGYGVRPSERGKGYAGRMLALALPRAKELGINRVLVSCDKSNTGSVRTILKNGGVLENEVLYEGEVVQRYWIDLGEG